MGGERAAAFGRQPVEPAAPFSRLLDPLPGDEPALLEPIEHRVEEGDVEPQDPSGAQFDEFADLVAVPCASSTSASTSSSALPFFTSGATWAFAICDHYI